MIASKKKLYQWIVMLACVAVVTVGITLVVCFSTQTAKPMITGYKILGSVADSDYIVTPQGKLLKTKDYSTFQIQSLNGQTAILRWKDGSFVVCSRYGQHYMEKKVNSHYAASLYLSHDGEVLYFIDEQNVLWHYKVKNQKLSEIQTIGFEVAGGRCSPKGNTLMLWEQGEKKTIHFYQNKKEVGTYTEDDADTFDFVTDAGTVFYRGSYALNLKSMDKNGEIKAITEQLVESVTWNFDGTEILFNCAEGAYLLIGDRKIKLLEEGVCEACLPMGVSTTTIHSFRDVNLINTNTGERMKLTKDYQLVVQEGSGKMLYYLSDNGGFMYYKDENGDYFYTDTKDVQGKYNLLWEASKEGLTNRLVEFTAKKNVFYLDDDLNLHYVKNGRDTILWTREEQKFVKDYTIDLYTDTVYYCTENAVYCSREGGRFSKVLEFEKKLTMELVNDQTYCYNLIDGVFYQLHPNGSYTLLKEIEEGLNQ